MDIAAVLWYLWRHRNDKAWEGAIQNVRMAVQIVREGIYQWVNVRTCQKHSEQQRDISWQAPKEGYVKCNVDSTLFSDHKCFGIGICIRNSQGHFTKAL